MTLRVEVPHRIVKKVGKTGMLLKKKKLLITSQEK